jgi:hypothetical protein
MDPNTSALERAFQLAKSGRVSTVEEIKKSLKREGYDDKAIDGGRSLRSQLNALMKVARVEAANSSNR